MTKDKSRGVWNASDCVLMLIDYQDHTLETVFEQDRRVIERNARMLAEAALLFKVPVILSTVGVELGANGPTIASLRAVLPDAKDIDRSSLNAWEDAKFVDAVAATGRSRLVMCGIVTSVCLAYPAVDALAAGHEVAFVEDAVADCYQEWHDLGVQRLVQAGAVPMTTSALVSEWFRDWKSPLAPAARDLFIPYFDDLAALKRAPQVRGPAGLIPTPERGRAAAQQTA